MGLTIEALRSFERTMAENMGIMTTLTVIFACIIAFGVVYNAARVSLSERSYELASLRVLGFRRAEISLILLGELRCSQRHSDRGRHRFSDGERDPAPRNELYSFLWS